MVANHVDHNIHVLSKSKGKWGNEEKFTGSLSLALML